MRNYYKIFGFEDDSKINDKIKGLSDEQLQRLLKDAKSHLRSLKSISKDEEERRKIDKEIEHIIKFQSALNNYGSKQNYDRALEKSNYRKAKIKKYGKIAAKVVLSGTLAGVIIGGVVIDKSYDIVEIPLMEDQSIETVLEDNFDYKTSKLLKDNKVIVKSSMTDNINKYVENYYNSLQNEKEDKKYSFMYIVQAGDTIWDLEKNFKAIEICDESGDKIKSDIYMDQVINIITYDENIAIEGQALYNDIMLSKEPCEFIRYVVKKGELLPIIAARYGVTVSQIMKYNSNITDMNTIYEGDELIIPVYSLEKENYISK